MFWKKYRLLVQNTEVMLKRIQISPTFEVQQYFGGGGNKND